MHMSWSFKEVATYRVYVSPRETTFPGMVLIALETVGGAYWLWFTAASPLPPNTIGPLGGTAYFPVGMFDTIIDLVRSEKPLYVQVESSSGQVWIASSQEPLGEGPVDLSP